MDLALAPFEPSALDLRLPLAELLAWAEAARVQALGDSVLFTRLCPHTGARIYRREAIVARFRDAFGRIPTMHEAAVVAWVAAKHHEAALVREQQREPGTRRIRLPPKMLDTGVDSMDSTDHLRRHMGGGKPVALPPYIYAGADKVEELPEGQSYYGHRFVATVQGVVGCGPTPADAVNRALANRSYHRDPHAWLAARRKRRAGR